MFERASRPTLIAAVCTAAGLVLAAASAPSHAGRFGGGRSVGMSRSLPSGSTHTAPHTAPHVDTHAETPAPGYRAPLIVHEPLQQAAPARSSYQATRDATMAEALLRSRMLAAQRRQRAQESGMNAGFSSGSAAAIPYDPPEYRPLPPVATPRVSDPRFTRFTPHEAPATPCEIKPVMSDADYRACGATPPSY
ncbi:hypothetical protein [Zoogloea dura]|jgi:hypothetical protein|uniref:Uncharacterized protein n=1 Tax=Zoogloea dura TaxID=2728840 RepID=A0A848G5P0_9RHOO|nr:hypothetical protein [Zoogloea dura]NML24971.1 hypothetical protein [Zoogloea dura]